MTSSETYTVAVFGGFQDLPETLPAAEAEIWTVVSDMVNPRGINSFHNLLASTHHQSVLQPVVLDNGECI